MKATSQIIYSMLICLTGITTVKAQAQRLSLDSVLDRIAANPALQGYDAKISAEDAYAGSAKSLDAPRISAGQFMTPYQLNPNTGSFMVSAEQMFTNPAKLRAKEEYMKGISKVTAAEKSYLRNQLASQAKQAYYERVILEKKLALLQNTQGLLEYMLKASNIRLTYGKEKLSNIYKAKADLFELDNTREDLNNEIRQRNIMLNTLMNKEKQTAFDVDTTLVIKDYETAVTDTAVLAGTRSDIKGISQNIALQQLNAKVEYSKRKPDFGVQAGHMFSYGGMSDQYTLMGSITIPIVPWASRAYKANLKGIRYEMEELSQKRTDLLNQAEGQLAGLKTDLRSKKRQLKNYRQNIIPALQNNYRTSLLAYEQNTGELLSVLDGIKGLQAARMEALNRLQELLLIQVNYERENESN